MGRAWKLHDNVNTDEIIPGTVQRHHRPRVAGRALPLRGAARFPDRRTPGRRHRRWPELWLRLIARARADRHPGVRCRRDRRPFIRPHLLSQRGERRTGRCSPVPMRAASQEGDELEVDPQAGTSSIAPAARRTAPSRCRPSSPRSPKREASSSSSSTVRLGEHGMNVGILYSRVRVEEKLLFDEFRQRGIDVRPHRRPRGRSSSWARDASSSTTSCSSAASTTRARCTG